MTTKNIVHLAYHTKNEEDKQYIKIVVNRKIRALKCQTHYFQTVTSEKHINSELSD